MDIREQLATALGDRYRVERELGRGGMAVVFLAEDLKHHRRVAIKLLKPELSAVIGGERFLREIEIAATLQHPHILPLYDSGDAGGLLFYVMPFAEGESLRQRLAREMQLPLDVALQITRDVGSALQYAHEHGVIHRDIKPENIMLSGGHAVVADFGIARVLGAANADQLTVTGMSVGTPQYMSPEQASAGVVDARSDQYSLACTVYEMLAGQPPFVGPSSQAVIARHLMDPVPSLRVVRQTVPKPLEAAIVQAMAKLPADRFPSIERFLEALNAPTTAEQPSASPAAPPRALGPRGRRALVMALGAGVLATAIWWVAAGRPPRGARTGLPSVRSVAVLPFQDLTSNPDSTYLRDGMTDGLTTDLAQIQSLKVLSRASASMAPGDSRPLAQVARELGVDAVVKGSIRRSGDTVWVSVRFLRGPDSTVLFTKDYQRRLGELPNLQREITTAITSSISTNLEGAERSRLDTRREVDHRAYEAYLRGRFHLERGELDQAKALFEQAMRFAPDWAPPNVGLASYYTSLPFYSDTMPVDVLPKARAALARALELDETLAEAHAANGYIRAYYEWDWRAAEQEFRRAVQLQPSYADAYFSYSRFLASRRRLKEAIEQLDRAVELDPLSLSLQANRALLDYFAGRYDTAATRLQTILKADSTDVLSKWAMALVAEQRGNPDTAIAILEPITGASLNRKTALGHAYALARKTAMARGVLRELHQRAAQSYVPAYDFALLYVALGQRDEALRYLERAYTERSTVLAYVMIDPRLASLREEPRFIALTKRLGGE
jgi:serine/threonine-protein kinase